MDQVRRVVTSLARSVGTPRALAVKMLVDAGEWAQLQQLRVGSPSTYPCSESYFRDVLITELLRKCDLNTGVDKEKAALETFWSSEARCCKTNARLSRFLPHKLLIEPGDEPVVHFISEWRKEVSLAILKLPDSLTPRFSGGATYADSGKLTTIPDKMSSIPTIYADATDLLPFWWESGWGRISRERSPSVVRGNIFFTVPKDGTKFRGCAKEASIPVSFQLDAARVLRKGLKRIGIDLVHGWSLHREAARSASVDGSRATLDMSNASDTLSKVLVELLLPKGWFVLLDSLRAKMTRVEGKWVRLEKFSSMGNGFTFELETLIFATLARTLIRLEGGDPDLVMCYGDDLIVPTEHSASVLSALEFFGFQPNTEKSFWEGPFRESCGGDFFCGTPVRGHYMKELPDEPQQWIALANGLRRIDPSMRYVKSAWMECLKNIPSAIRQCRGPELLGDLVIHDHPDFWSFKSLRHCDGGDEEKQFRAYVPVPQVLNWHHWKPEVQLQGAILGIPSRGVSPRGALGYKLGWVPDPTGNRFLPTTSVGR